VEEVTALFHLLARYVVNTEPTSIVEELMPVAVPVYSGSPSGDSSEPLGRAATQQLLRAMPAAETRTELEVKEALADALGIQTLEHLFGNAVEARRVELAAERRAMKRPFAQAPLGFPRDTASEAVHRREDGQMAGREGAQAAEWLQGIDSLSPGSSDLLAVTLLFPT
jgi:hypothetical protein